MVIVSEEGELRVSIYSAFPLRKSLPVSNPDTTVFARIDIPDGPLAVYGCLMGIHGRGRFQAAHLRFFPSFLSFFFASWLPAAACFESSSALAFFTWFSFTSCFLLVGIQSPRYAFG